MEKKSDMLDKAEDPIEEQKKAIRLVLASKRKRLQDKIKVENTQKKVMLKKTIEEIEKKIDEIKKGEEIQLNEIEQEISKEEKDIISALEEEIKIKTIIISAKKKIEKDKLWKV